MCPLSQIGSREFRRRSSSALMQLRKVSILADAKTIALILKSIARGAGYNFAAALAPSLFQTQVLLWPSECRSRGFVRRMHFHGSSDWLQRVCIALVALVFASPAIAEKGKLRDRLTPSVMA